jgi:nucleotide-binding universal stress UspA family protein
VAVFHRILVGVDDSRAGQLALERAIELAEESHGRIGLLVSAPEPSGVIWASPVAIPHSREGMCRQLENWACKVIEAATARVPSEIPITKLVTHGDAAAALLREAETGCWDLVVVGQAARPLRLPFQRSVGERLRDIGTPVLVVHEKPEPVAPPAATDHRPHPAAAALRALRGQRRRARPSA